jgi:hypothetical protein
MIAALEILFAIAGALFVMIWMVCIAGMVSASRRAARATGGRLQLADLLAAPGPAFLSAVNVVSFLVMLGWYALLRKPLPPTPKPWRHFH